MYVSQDPFEKGGYIAWDIGGKYKAVEAVKAKWQGPLKPGVRADAFNALVEALNDALMVMTSQKVRIEEQADAITKARQALATLKG